MGRGRDRAAFRWRCTVSSPQAGEAESAAALLPLLDQDDERIRRGVAAILLNERDALRRVAGASHGWRDRDLATARAGRDLEAASEKLMAVLGDVDRPDAIQPFEYIRNSSIEGEIAQSEIAKVEFASTRSQKVVQRWVLAQADHRVETVSPIVVRPLPGRSAESVEAKLTIARAGVRSDVVLVLERRLEEWRIVEERGAGGVIFER